MKYIVSPTKLSQQGFDLGTDSDRDDEGDKFPIHVDGTDSSDSPVEVRGQFSMNISRNHSGDKRKGRQRGKKERKKGTVQESYPLPSSKWLALVWISPQLRDLIRRRTRRSTITLANYYHLGMWMRGRLSISSRCGSYAWRKIRTRTVLQRHHTCGSSLSSIASSATISHFRTRVER